MTTYEHARKSLRRKARGIFCDYYGLRFAWFVTFLLGGIAITIALGVFGGVNWSRGIDQRACRSFGENTGRVTKFATYNWGSWQCLVRASDGRYLPKGQILSYVRGEGVKP